MASRYIFACNYGTYDGEMGQINNKVLIYDKNLLIVKNHVEGFTKAFTLRNSIVDAHSNNICLKQVAINIDKISIFSLHNEPPFKFVYDLRESLNFLHNKNFYKTHTSFN